MSSLRSLVKVFLDAHRKMVLAVLDEHGHPNTSLMLYTVDDKLNFYFGTRKQFGKYKALAKNNRVAMLVQEEGLDPLRVVDAQGQAHELSAEETKEKLAYLESKNPAKYYVKDADDFVMFRITPESIRWLDATSGELKSEVIPLE